MRQHSEGVDCRLTHLRPLGWPARASRGPTDSKSSAKGPADSEEAVSPSQLLSPTDLPWVANSLHVCGKPLHPHPRSKNRKTHQPGHGVVIQWPVGTRKTSRRMPHSPSLRPGSQGASSLFLPSVCWGSCRKPMVLRSPLSYLCCVPSDGHADVLEDRAGRGGRTEKAGRECDSCDSPLLIIKPLHIVTFVQNWRAQLCVMDTSADTDIRVD